MPIRRARFRLFDRVSDPARSDGLSWTSAGLVVLILMFVAAAAILIDGRRRDPVAPA
jgi:hypothetical protein